MERAMWQPTWKHNSGVLFCSGPHYAAAASLFYFLPLVWIWKQKLGKMTLRRKHARLPGPRLLVSSDS